MIKNNFTVNKKFKYAQDTLGKIRLPKEALYGACTERAVQNFKISGWKMPKHFIQVLGLIKYAAAYTNSKLGLLEKEKANAIKAASLEIFEGLLYEHFPVDIFQIGSGTSTNMNVNEVIATRAIQKSGGRTNIHPNDHCNLGQSTNDVLPTAFRVSTVLYVKNLLIPALKDLYKELNKKASEWKNITKIGRTHLMDAVPMSLGEEFSAYARQIEKDISRSQKIIEAFIELPIGGTAIGSGLNCHPNFKAQVIEILSNTLNIKFVSAKNLFEAQASQDDSIEAIGNLEAIANSLYKICSDVRLMASGPNAGLNELKIPVIQEGSSCMPGKNNPVICESVQQVVYMIRGYGTTIRNCAASSQFELNHAIPLLIHSFNEAIRLLTNAIVSFRENCLIHLQANLEKLKENTENSVSKYAELLPIIGYEKTAMLINETHNSNQPFDKFVEQTDLLNETEKTKVALAINSK